MHLLTSDETGTHIIPTLQIKTWDIEELTAQGHTVSKRKVRIQTQAGQLQSYHKNSSLAPQNCLLKKDTVGN